MKKLTIMTAAWALTATLAAGSVLAQQGPGRWMADNDNTQGWSLMTPQERTEHQNKMQSFKTYDECTAYQAMHHNAMVTRAKEQGVTLPAMTGGSGCDNMKAHGFLK